MPFVLNDLQRYIRAYELGFSIVVTATAHYHLKTTHNIAYKPTNNRQLLERQAASSQ
jgi:hypothetical protein